MRLSRFLLTIGLLTFSSLLYVYQQTEILRLAYMGQKRIMTFQDLLDKNSILRYNINRNVSLVHIGNRFSKMPDFKMPESFRLVRGMPSKANIKMLKKKNIAFDFLGILGFKREAQAKTVNPSTTLRISGE